MPWSDYLTDLVQATLASLSLGFTLAVALNLARSAWRAGGGDR